MDKKLSNEQLERLNNATHICYDDNTSVLPIENQDRKRDWFLTINAGAECRQNGKISYENMEDFLIREFKNLVYACWDEEVGDNGNNHIHLYVSMTHGKSFSKMKKLFPGANIEPKKGSAFYAANYIKKPKGLELKGKEKSHTQIKTAIEIGDFDNIIEKGIYNKDGTIIKKQKQDINEILKIMVLQFDTMEDMAEFNPKIFNLYNKTLALMLDTKRKNKLLNLPITEKIVSESGEEFYVINRKVSYVWGLNGAGKTYGVYKKYGFKNVGLVTFNKDNTANFDNYNNQETLLVDDFSGNIPFSVLQHMTDSYIKPLDARYQDKKTYYSNCIFTSNIPFGELYPNIKDKNLDRYNSMIRRFTGGVWEVFQDYNGTRYIALHTELLPQDMRFGDKYANLESPLSRDFRVVSLETLELIKAVDFSLENMAKYNIIDVEYQFTINKDGTSEIEIIKKDTKDFECIPVPF